MTGSEFCWFHNPDRARERRSAQRAGGKARHGRSLAETETDPVTIETVADILTGLQTVANDLRLLENSISRGKALTAVFSAALPVIQAADFDARLAALEAKIGG